MKLWAGYKKTGFIIFHIHYVIMELKHPFTMILAGSSRSGKSVFTEKLIRNAYVMIKPRVTRVVYCYNNYQERFKDMHGVEFFPNLDILEELKSLSSENTVLILDDYMKEADKIADFFTRFSHHSNLSVIFITQNVFHQKKGMRDLTLSTQYLVLMRNVRDRSQISILARQLEPDNTKYIMDSYKDATEKPYSYLLIDFCQTTPNDRRLVSCIFPGETLVYYTPKKL